MSVQFFYIYFKNIITSKEKDRDQIGLINVTPDDLGNSKKYDWDLWLVRHIYSSHLERDHYYKTFNEELN